MKSAIEKAARRAAFELFNRRDGHPGIRRYLDEFNRFSVQDASAQQAHAFQRLQAIVRYAYQHSPYYAESWNARGVHPSQLKALAVIQRFGFIDKETIKSNKERLKSTTISSLQSTTSFTGGTSGTQTSFLIDRICTATRMGRQWAILERCGYRIGARCGLVWGVHDDLLPASGATRLKWRLRNFASGKETLHCAVLTPSNMAEFQRRLLRFRPDVLYGYPDAMSHFARFLVEEKLPAPQVRSIICTAEKLTARNRELLKSVFGGEVFNLYCTREHGCIGFECTRHNGFHVDLGSLWLEIVKDGDPVAPGGSGEIVITDFNNLAMPFIRNRIGDYGRLAESPCDCGCALPMLQQLEGRVTDTLYRADGSKIDGGLLTDIFIDTREIKAMQIIQTDIDRVELKLVVTDNFTEDTERLALAELQPMLGPGIRIEVKKVDEIPRNPVSGKYQEVICRVRPQGNGQP